MTFRKKMTFLNSSTGVGTTTSQKQTVGVRGIAAPLIELGIYPRSSVEEGEVEER